MLKKFISYYKPHKKLFIADMVCAFILSMIDLLFPAFTRIIMNEHIPNNNLGAIYNIGFFLFAMIVVRCICNWFVLFWGHIMGSKIERDMRADLFKKYQTLNFSYYDENQTGKIMNRLVGDLREIAEVSHHAPEDLFTSLTLLIGSFILLLKINVQLTLAIFVFIIAIFLFSFWQRKKMMKAFRDVRTTQADINAQIESSISGIRLMKSFTNEKKEFEKFSNNNNKYFTSWFKAYNSMGIFHSGSEFLIDIANLVLLIFGGYLVINANMSAGDMTAFFLYITYLIRPIQRLRNFMEQVQSCMSGFERFYEVLQIDPKIKSPSNGVIVDKVLGNIEFKNVNFKYPSNENHVLNNFNLEIKPGTKIALVGETGVGKSTISQLIPRFYDITSGDILIDDVSIKDYDLHSLRTNIGHVQQDVFILYDNIKENIRYGNINATDDQVYEAAKKANIHDFITTLEHGYDTLVGERGVKLSGGQKQRIAIARVFLKDPQILILDEATSALDNITEVLIQNSLDTLSQGRTTIIIAHRLSTVKTADEILVLGKDGIMERGNHEQLLKNNGYYTKLHNARD